MNEATIFHALADPNRRALLDRLRLAELNATELRQGLGISQPAVSQHVAVLRKAGLIVASRQGRQVRYRIDPDGLRPLLDWLQRYQGFWPQRLDNLQTLLEEMDHE
ncbi:transcriptional regulator [Salinicola endophyticus]|uniref:Transcriptional regulator n=1 Tax=Salinicola endophyticus TaxID=1949083 RepID=A0ABY8FM33_9GAMM|nr:MULTISPECIES: metalloregulator ArsR/SmtB family transcription factor [Salinicola]WFF42261.1 transcriptional regulator [Salinicola endophyticus]